MTWLVFRFIWEFALYDLARLFTPSFYTKVGAVRRKRVEDADARIEKIHAALRWAIALYPKHIRCLQQSSAMTRILRREGLAAQLVIAYRPEPFMGHAWVELGAHALDGAGVFAKRLTILARLG